MIIYSHKETVVKDQLSMYETNHSNNCISSDSGEMVNFKPGEYLRKMIFRSVPQATGKKKNPSTPRRSRTYDHLVSSRDVALTD